MNSSWTKCVGLKPSLSLSGAVPVLLDQAVESNHVMT